MFFVIDESDSLAMEDPFVSLMNDSFVTPQAGRSAERPAADTTGKLWSRNRINNVALQMVPFVWASGTSPCRAPSSHDSGSLRCRWRWSDTEGRSTRSRHWNDRRPPRCRKTGLPGLHSPHPLHRRRHPPPRLPPPVPAPSPRRPRCRASQRISTWGRKDWRSWWELRRSWRRRAETRVWLMGLCEPSEQNDRKTLQTRSSQNFNASLEKSWLCNGGYFYSRQDSQYRTWKERKKGGMNGWKNEW